MLELIQKLIIIVSNIIQLSMYSLKGTYKDLFIINTSYFNENECKIIICVNTVIIYISIDKYDLKLHTQSAV